MSGIRFDFDDSFNLGRQVLERFGRTVEPAVMRALNRAADGMPGFMTDGIRGEYHLPAARIRKTFRVRHASMRDLSASVNCRSGSMPLYLFGVRPAQPGARPAAGVQVDVMGRKPIEGAFVARMKSGHVGVWLRSEKSPRLPVHELFGPSVPDMLEKMDERTDFWDKIADEADGRFNKRIEHEIDHLFRQLGLR